MLGRDLGRRRSFGRAPGQGGAAGRLQPGRVARRSSARTGRSRSTCSCRQQERIPLEVLETYVREQIEDSVSNLFSWPEAGFHFCARGARRGGERRGGHGRRGRHHGGHAPRRRVAGHPRSVGVAREGGPVAVPRDRCAHHAQAARVGGRELHRRPARHQHHRRRLGYRALPRRQVDLWIDRCGPRDGARSHARPAGAAHGHRAEGPDRPVQPDLLDDGVHVRGLEPPARRDARRGGGRGAHPRRACARTIRAAACCTAASRARRVRSSSAWRSRPRGSCCW